jgi:hypothetical protein
LRFEKTVHFVPRTNSQQAASLGHRELSGANRFQGKTFQGGARQVFGIGGDPSTQVLWDV